jgi:hypothetical protein
MPAIRSLRLVLGLVVLSVIALLVAGAAFLHFDPLCGEETIRELPSPDGHYIAVALERNCGATTSYVDHVNVRSANRKLSPDFFDGTIKDGEVFTFDRGDRADSPCFYWSDNRTLKIENSCDERTSKSDSWRDVKIDYTDLTCQSKKAHSAKTN